MGRTDLRPDITKEVLEEYIRKGYSQNRKAITLGTTQSTIFNKLKKYGLPFPLHEFRHEFIFYEYIRHRSKRRHKSRLTMIDVYLHEK